MASDGTRVFVLGGCSERKWSNENSLISVFDTSMYFRSVISSGQSKIENTEHIKFPDPEPYGVNPNEKPTQLGRKSFQGPPTEEQPQHLAPSSSEAHGFFSLQNATPAVSGRPASPQITHKRNPGPNGRPLKPMGSMPRRVPEDDVSEGLTERRAKFAAPHSSSEGEATRLELERQLSVLLAAQTERDKRIAQLTDELALKSAPLEQAEANASEEAMKRARSASRDHEDRLAQASLVKQRDVELKDMQAKLDELQLSRDQQIGQHEKELANVRAELEAKKSELEAICLRLSDAEDGWAKSMAKADTFHTVTAASLVDLNEDRTMCEGKEDMQDAEAELASLKWNEKGIEAMECRNEG